MAKSAWYPRATRQDYSGTYPGASQPQVGIVVLHSTETTGQAGYSSGAVAPHLEYHPPTRTWRQFFPFTMSSRALANASGGVETNRHPAGVVQVELCGTSGWAAGRVTPVWPNVTDTQILGDIAHFLAWMRTEWGTPLTTPMNPWPAWNASQRLSAAAWTAVRGIVGHSMVPENNHTDPGAFPIGKTLNLAKTIVEENDMQIDDDVTWVRSDGNTHTGVLGLYYWDIGNRLYALEKALLWLGAPLFATSDNSVVASSVRNNLIHQTLYGQEANEKLEELLSRT